MSDRKKFQCPNCGSNETKSVRAIYLQHYEIEEKEIIKKTGSVSTSSISCSKGNERSVKHKRTLLVENCKPPKKPAHYPIINVMISSFIITFILWSSDYLSLGHLEAKLQIVIYFIIFIGIHYVLNKGLRFLIGNSIVKKEMEYFEEANNWIKKWYCYKCSTTWIEE